ncbi:unnamed protein product [Camellia sinensis]
MNRPFSQRQSLLKFAPMQCTKGEKASYCLACLISLVEQVRTLRELSFDMWGIVRERPEYGYATYFFEFLDFLPINWQIKHLVTAMKLPSCSRVTLIENKALLGVSSREGTGATMSGDITYILKAWWQSHSKWPYPTAILSSCGLDNFNNPFGNLGEKEKNEKIIGADATSEQQASKEDEQLIDSILDEVRVRFIGFGSEEDEWVNVKKAIREHSLPLEHSKCGKLEVGDLVNF